MTNSIAPAAALTPERLAEYAALNFTDLMTPDAAAVVARMRDQLVGEIRWLQSYIARIEAVLCECEPEREPHDYRQPGVYMHAAGCLVADLQQGEAVTS